MYNKNPVSSCYGSNLQWDNGTHGNYWANYFLLYPHATLQNGIWSIPYQIQSNIFDHFPLKIDDNVLPILHLIPNDGSRYSFIQGMVWKNITWHIHDIDYAVTEYRLTLNGTFVHNGTWIPDATYSYNLGDLVVGKYYLNVSGLDGLGGSFNQTVLVEISINEAPTLTMAVEQKYEIPWNQRIEITIDDKTVQNPFFQVFIDNALNFSGIWTHTIYSGYKIVLNFSSFKMGEYNIVVFIADGCGKNVTTSFVLVVTSEDQSNDNSFLPASIDMNLFSVVFCSIIGLLFIIRRSGKRRKLV
jgi:hypothetical protein